MRSSALDVSALHFDHRNGKKVIATGENSFLTPSHLKKIREAKNVRIINERKAGLRIRGKVQGDFRIGNRNSTTQKEARIHFGPIQGHGALVAEMDTSQTFRIQGRHEVLRRNPVAPANLVDLSLLHAVPQEGHNRDQYGWFSPIQLILPFAGSLV